MYLPSEYQVLLNKLYDFGHVVELDAVLSLNQ